MSERAKIIEVMSRAMAGVLGHDRGVEEIAETALSALHAKGLAVVPGWQPTEATKRPQLYTDGYYARRIANGERPASHTTNSTKEGSDE